MARHPREIDRDEIAASGRLFARKQMRKFGSADWLPLRSSVRTALQDDSGLKGEMITGRINAGLEVTVRLFLGQGLRAGLAATVGTVFPGVPLAEYQQASGLEGPLACGFEVAGALRVWFR